MTPAQKAKKTRADKKATAAALNAQNPEQFAIAADLLDQAAVVCDEVGDKVGACSRRDNAKDFRAKADLIPLRTPTRASNDFDY